jgi:capsular polysaccharide biosynthesis protein
MRETLALWGIAKDKIISPTHEQFCIHADEVIVPSMVVNVNFDPVDFACYAQPYLLEYVRNKLLPAAQKRGASVPLGKRVFISRKDTHLRQIINEDEFFNCFQQYGFTRYELGKMSVVDQILLFNQAEVIVSAQGTGLANIIFCNKNVKIFELFQGLNDATFWYLTQDFGLNYTPIKTVEFNHHYIKAYTEFTQMPLEIIEQIMELINKGI